MALQNFVVFCKASTWISHAAAATKSLQSCPTLCDPREGSPPGSPGPGILQARKVEWVAIAFSNACKQKVKVKLPSHVQLLVTPWTAAYQAPPSMGFSRQEYWSGLPLPSPKKGDKRPHISHSWNQENSSTAHGQKGSLELKRGVILSDANYP